MTAESIARVVDALDERGARAALRRCCGSHRWVEAMLARRPFATDQALMAAAAEVWFALGREDWLEAFSHHPRLGERRAVGAWSRAEQAGAAAASDEIQQALAAGNGEYERRFGHVFLLCASGRSGEEMLAELRRRMRRDPQEELATAAAEQAKITSLRLAKLSREERD